MSGLAFALCTAFLTVNAHAQGIPSYAQGNGDQQIRGRIVAFNGSYNLTIRDDQGYIDHVQLHEGTIINPTGLTLAPGMVVSILGYNAGPYFAANEIDTPYTMYGAVPYYLGHPWRYYGSSYGLNFFFNNTGWWHGDVIRGHAPIANIYHAHGGDFHGRDVVAPHARGGYHVAHGGGFHGGQHGH
jgi:hypothetical protein